MQRHDARLRGRQGGHVGRLLVEVLGDVLVADAVVVHGRQRVDALAVGRRRRCIARVLMVCLRINSSWSERASDLLPSQLLLCATRRVATLRRPWVTLKIDGRSDVGSSLCRDQQVHT